MHRPFIDRAELSRRVRIVTVVVGLNTILVVVVVVVVFIRSYATAFPYKLSVEDNTSNDFSFDLLKFEEKGWE